MSSTCRAICGLIGKSLIGLRDIDGKSFINEFVCIAGTKGSGRIDYRWPNPVTGVTEEKTAYIEKVQDLIIRPAYGGAADQ